MASASPVHRNEEAQLLTQNEGTIATRLRSASAPGVHPNEEAQLLTQNEGPIATRLRSASTPGVHLTEEAQLLTQNEGPIATRLRSRSKVGDTKTSQTESTGAISVNNQSDKPSQLSRHQKDKRNNSMAKKSETHTVSKSKTGQPSTDQRTKESNDSAPKGCEVHISSSCTTCLTSEDQGTENNKDSSETQSKQNLKNQHAKSKATQPQCEIKASSSGRTSQNSENQEPKKNKSSAPRKSDIPKPSSSDVGHEKEKTSISSQKPAKQTIKEDPVYRIRFEGFEKTTTAGWNCALCEKDLAHLPVQEEWGHSLLAEDELEYSFFLREEHELEQYSLLPEAAVLPCSHVFHSDCLSAMPLSDPLCPICLSLL